MRTSLPARKILKLERDPNLYKKITMTGPKVNDKVPVLENKA
jgi:hypothetical protein